MVKPFYSLSSSLMSAKMYVLGGVGGGVLTQMPIVGGSGPSGCAN